MSKRIEQFIPVTGIDKSIAANPDRCIDNPNRLRLSLSYTTGGVNYFTYKNEARGYYLHVTPEKVENHGFGNAICSLMGSGVKDLVLEVGRQSDKQLEIATTIAAERASALLEWCKREYGTLFELPAEFFPNAAKRPVPKAKPAAKPKVDLKKPEKPAEEIKPIRGMKLLTQEIIRKLEKHPFGSQEGKLDDAEVLVKFFGGGACTWLVTEGEQQEDGDWEFFGKVTLGYEWEWGYFRLSELEKMKFPPFGLGVERDMYLGGKTTVGQLAA